jgi:hypothetical protein
VGAVGPSGALLESKRTGDNPVKQAQPQPAAAGDARPILVVGHIRSGTKWLSNLLCNHPQIAGVQSERTGGIVETNMFHRMQTKFDLRAADDYVGFIELWRHTEFVRASGLDVSFLYDLDPRPRTFTQIFATVMERYASLSQSAYWLQKCGPDIAEWLKDDLRAPKLVLIARDELAVARSIRHMSRNRHGQFSLLKALPEIVHSQRRTRRLAASPDSVLVTYEELKKNTAASLEKICDFLELDFDPAMLEVPFSRNTSFSAGSAAATRPSDSRLEAATVAALRALPMAVLRQVLSLKKPKSLPRPFVSGTFSSMKEKLADRKDYY